MSGSTQVRQTIELLSTILEENGASLVSAETLRLAKFNKDEATSVMWKLLFELVYFRNYGTIDESAIKAAMELSQEELCVVVKRELQSRGYLSHDFAHLPNDYSTGSRELLLAFAWLLCKESVIEKFMDKCTSPLDDDMSNWCKEWPVSSENVYPDPHSESKLTPGQRVNKLLMLNWKLKLNLRRMYAAQQQEAKLLAKIENSTKGVSLTSDRDSLSVLEVHLLRHPHLLKKMLVLLDKDNERLRNLLNWRQHEDVFWKWMDSVLDLKVKSLADPPSSEVRSGAVYLDVPDDAPRKIQVARQQLVQSILGYEDTIQNLEHFWDSKRHDISTQELDNLIAAINMDISVHKANLMLMSASAVAKTIHPEPSFKLHTGSGKSSGKMSNLLVQHDRGAGDTGGVDIQLVNNDLAKQIENLKFDLCRMHRDCQKMLVNLASNIPNAICIEPTAIRDPDLYV